MPSVRSSVSRTAGTNRYLLIGLTGSPYSMKMRAILRYRRIPFDWVIRFPQVEPDPPPVRPLLVPILRFPDDGSYRVDSTPLAHALEDRHPGERSIVPDDPALAFLSDLIEDMADEWCTKIMFHYRWSYPEDIAYCSRWLASEIRPDADLQTQKETGAAFAKRQIERLPLVGCSPENRPVIEESYHRLISVLEAAIGAGGPQYLFGSRPALADFALLGQFSQLAADPVPAALIRAQAQSLMDWLRRLDDASGVEGTWSSWEESSSSEFLRGLLTLVGDTYLPFLAANAAAIAAGKMLFALEIRGRPFSQTVFRYQLRCFERLRLLYSGLGFEARRRVDSLLHDTGCRPFLET